jgi:uncharacterized membrane protein
MSVLASRLRLVSLDWLRVTMIVLCLAGLGVSAYLMWGYSVPGATLSCGGSSGCEAVKNSEFSNILGIPMPLIGLLSYGALLGLLIGQSHISIVEGGWSAYVALAIFGVSLTGVLYSAYLTYLEIFVIYAICRWCVASAVIMVAIFLLSVFNLQNSNQS